MRINKANFTLMMLSLIATIICIEKDYKILLLLNTFFAMLNAYLAFENEGKK